MASQSLYRKWRSQTFGDLVGQEPVIRTLKNALKSGNLAHAYLFTGPRGTGKTSTARLLAKTVNCLHPVDDEPCNTCEQCREITAGSSFNVLEIDAASNRGIDSIRELREKVMMPPTTGKYKVYILDEAHMLTVEAFNALLKTLEEPPPHAIFVMATTDVHKMLPTVLSRCQRFDFKRITARQIVNHLRFVAEQEHVELEGGAAELIARAAAGGMRDALSLLDQAIAYSGNVISLTQVQSMLGVADPRAIQKFIGYIAELDSPGGLHLIHELSEAGADLRQINLQVAEYWRAMMLARAGANIADILDNTDDEMREITQMTRNFNLDELTECARIFAQNDLMQKSQGTPQLGLELAFLACIELHRRAQDGIPLTSTTAPIPSTPVARSRPTNGSTPGQYRGVETTSQRTPAPVETRQAPVERAIPSGSNEISLSVEESRSMVAPSQMDSEAASVQIPERHTAPLEHPQIEHPQINVSLQTDTTTATIAIEENSANAESYGAPTLTIDGIREKWEIIRRRVKTRKDGPKIAALLGGYSLIEVEGTADLPIVVIKATADFHYKSLQKDEYIEHICWAMKIELGLECKVRLLSPTASVSIRPAPQSVTGIANTAPPRASQPGVRREPTNPPSASSLPPTPSQPENRMVPPSPVPQRKVAEKRGEDPLPIVAPSSSAPIARTPVVRENKKIASTSSETHRQVIEKHAKNDPVVKEVVRLFKAEIKDIQPK